MKWLSTFFHWIASLLHQEPATTPPAPIGVQSGPLSDNSGMVAGTSPMPQQQLRVLPANTMILEKISGMQVYMTAPPEGMKDPVYAAGFGWLERGSYVIQAPTPVAPQSNTPDTTDDGIRELKLGVEANFKSQRVPDARTYTFVNTKDLRNLEVVPSVGGLGQGYTGVQVNLRGPDGTIIRSLAGNYLDLWWGAVGSGLQLQVGAVYSVEVILSRGGAVVVTVR